MKAEMVAQGPAEQIPHEGNALIHMIERVARDPTVNMDKLERLMEMQERVIERNSRSAYFSALSSMQPELPTIIERGKIDIGRGKPQSYALWEDINDKIKPVLAKYGFALSFRTGQEDGKIIVTGILSHRDGHSEQTTMHLPVDTSGSKNAVQAVGSSTSYGKRYTAGALLNLTSRGEDDDGRAGGLGVISEQQAQELLSLIKEVNANEANVCKACHVASLTDMTQSQFEKAKAKLETMRVPL